MGGLEAKPTQPLRPKTEKALCDGLNEGDVLGSLPAARDREPRLTVVAVRQRRVVGEYFALIEVIRSNLWRRANSCLIAEICANRFYLCDQA
jgi:hypothetical protein